MGGPVHQFRRPTPAGGSAERPAAVGVAPARPGLRSGFPSTSLLHWQHLRMLYPSLSTLATRMADGRVGRTWTDHESSVERELA